MVRRLSNLLIHITFRCEIGRAIRLARGRFAILFPRSRGQVCTVAVKTGSRKVRGSFGRKASCRWLPGRVQVAGLALARRDAAIPQAQREKVSFLSDPMVFPSSWRFWPGAFEPPSSASVGPRALFAVPSLAEGGTPPRRPAVLRRSAELLFSACAKPKKKGAK